MVRNRRRSRGRYARAAHLAAAGADKERRPAQDRAGPDADHPPRKVDRLLAPDHPSRPRPVHCAQAQVRRMSNGNPVPRRRQNLEHGGDSQDRQSVTKLGALNRRHRGSADFGHREVDSPLLARLNFLGLVKEHIAVNLISLRMDNFVAATLPCRRLTSPLLVRRHPMDLGAGFRKLTLGALAVSFFAAGSSASAQQASCPPGSACATTTIDGKQLPPPPQKFEGKIGRNAAQSTPYWPARVEPPKGAPNILLIMTDDSGFGVPSTFGGVIPTPALDRIAAMGLRYTNFNSTALCSPTRAALITGRNLLAETGHRPRGGDDGLGLHRFGLRGQHRPDCSITAGHRADDLIYPRCVRFPGGGGDAVL